MSCYIILLYLMLSFTVPCHVTLSLTMIPQLMAHHNCLVSFMSNIMLYCFMCHIVPCRVTLSHVMFSHTTSQLSTVISSLALCHTVSCVKLSLVMSHCLMTCYLMSHHNFSMSDCHIICPVPCNATLSHVISWHIITVQCYIMSNIILYCLICHTVQNMSNCLMLSHSTPQLSTVISYLTLCHTVSCVTLSSVTSHCLKSSHDTSQLYQVITLASHHMHCPMSCHTVSSNVISWHITSGSKYQLTNIWPVLCATLLHIFSSVTISHVMSHCLVIYYLMSHYNFPIFNCHIMTTVPYHVTLSHVILWHIIAVQCDTISKLILYCLTCRSLMSNMITWHTTTVQCHDIFNILSYCVMCLTVPCHVSSHEITWHITTVQCHTDLTSLFHMPHCPMYCHIVLCHVIVPHHVTLFDVMSYCAMAYHI